MMANRYEIAANFTLVDNATKVLNRMGVSGGLLGRTLSRSYAAAEERLASFGAAASRVGKMAAGAGIGAVAAGLAVATKEFVEFDNALTKAGALFGDTQGLTGSAFADALDQIGAKARAVAAVTEFTATDMAGALQQMAMAGISANIAMDMLKGTTDLATAAGMDLTRAVEISSRAIGMLGKEKSIAAFGDDVAGQMQRINDVMALTAASFPTDIDNIWQALSNSAPGFINAGQTLDTLAASIGALSFAYDGATAGTNLNALMKTFSSGAKQKALAGKGINLTDASGNFLNLFDIVEQIERKTSGLGEAQRAAWLSDIFDVRALRAMNELLNTGTEKLRQYELNVMNAGGASIQMAETMRTSILNQVQVLRSGLTELGFRFVEAFKGQGSDALQRLIDAVQNFDPAPLIAGAERVLNSIMGIARTVWNLRGVIIPTVAAWFVFQRAMEAVVIGTRIAGGISTMTRVVGELANGIGAARMAAQMGGLAMAGFNNTTLATRAGILLYNGALAIGKAATVAFTAVTGALNAVFVASPIGWIVLAVAALVAGIVLLIKNWETVSAAFMAFGDWITETFMGAWERLTSAFTNGGIIGGLKLIAGAIFSFLLLPLQNLLDTISKIPGVGNLTAGLADRLQGFRDGLTGGGLTAPPTSTMAAATNYSREEKETTNRLVVGLDDGLKPSSPVSAAPAITIERTRSGAF